MFVPSTTASAATARSISAAHCRLFVRYLRSLGLDPAPALAFVELSEDGLERNLLVPIASYLAFVRACMEATNDPDLGLHAGAQVRLDDIELIGLLARSAPDGREAYDTLQRHQHVWGAARDSDFTLCDGQIVCRQARLTRLPTPRVLGEYFAARTVTLGRAIGGALEPLAVRFMHPQPSRLDEHRRLFGSALLTFGEDHNELRFAASCFKRAQPHADPVVTQVALRCLEAAAPKTAGQAEHLPTRVRAIVAENLANGDVGLGAVARRLHQSERTLRRQLQACGTGYQVIVDDVRHELAVRYLEAGLSAAEVSERVGFREPGTIYRAFKRWTGRPMSESRGAPRETRPRSGLRAQ